MRKVWLLSLAACAALLFSGQLQAQEKYALGFSGPTELVGSAGDVITETYLCTLEQLDPEAAGAQGWSIGCVADGGEIVSATTDGTTTAEVFNGGFNKTGLATPEKNPELVAAGAVSAVVLCFGCPAIVPVDAATDPTGSLLAVEVAFEIPEGSGQGTLRYQDGLVGEGQPVALVVTENGASAPFVASDLVVDLIDVPSCCNAPYRVGFSTDSLANDVPGEGMIDDDPETCPGAGSVEIDEEDTLYAVVASNAGAGDGVQGWSLGMEVTGDIAITDATTDGTLAAPAPDGLFNGGFNKTGLALPENNDGKTGAVSAVVLCFGCGATLPEVGTSAVLALSVSGEKAAEGLVKYAENLVGEGQPVANVLTVNGASAPICNFATASAALRVKEGPPTLGPFVRADANDDGKVNIADPIWIINELFRGGPATGCQAAADANGDAAIDLADATYIIAYRFLLGPVPPAPFPECGTIVSPENGIITCDTPPTACQ